MGKVVVHRMHKTLFDLMVMRCREGTPAITAECPSLNFLTAWSSAVAASYF